MRITAKQFLSFIPATMLATSCTKSTVANRTLDYAFKNNKTYEEVINVVKFSNNQSIQQAKLDSLAFRNIFNTTKAAKDPAKVAEFDKTAKDMQSTFNEIDRILTEKGISPKEYNYNSFNLDKDLKDESVEYQYFADNWMYRKLFKKFGIMTDSVKVACDKVSKIIKP